MTRTEVETAGAAVKDVLLANRDGLRGVIRAVMQEILEARIDEAPGVSPGASKDERMLRRLGNRSGHCGRTPVTACRISDGFTTGDLAKAGADLAAWPAGWLCRYPRLTDWAEENIEQTPTFFRLPRRHHRHLKSTNIPERLNEKIRRRTYVARIFPNADSCLRLVRALAVETNENWMEASRRLYMDDPREHKELELRKAA